jgi:zinc transport system substrate-binding protein
MICIKYIASAIVCEDKSKFNQKDISMKKVYVAIAVIIAVLAGAIMVASISDDRNNESDKLKVAATIYPLYDITKEIAGDEFEVVLMLPPGASPHTFDPQPSLVKDLEGSQAVFAIGNGLDSWSDSLTDSIGAELVTVDTGIELIESEDDDEHSEDNDEHSDEDEHDEDEDDHSGEEEDEHSDDDEELDDEDEHGHGPVDPHYWLSIHGAEQIAMNIAAELSDLDSENTKLYTDRAEAYVEELEALESELEAKFAGIVDRNIISLHDAWNYFAADFDLTIVGTFEPTAGEEPTPKYLANLQDEVEENKVSTLFVEPQLSTSSIDTFAKDNNLNIAVIDPLGGVDGRDSYIALMRYNVDQVVSALVK